MPLEIEAARDRHGYSRRSQPDHEHHDSVLLASQGCAAEAGHVIRTLRIRSEAPEVRTAIPRPLHRYQRLATAGTSARSLLAHVGRTFRAPCTVHTTRALR